MEAVAPIVGCGVLLLVVLTVIGLAIVGVISLIR